jgi:hypothetical protein
MGATFLVCHGAWSAGWAWKKMHPPLPSRKKIISIIPNLASSRVSKAPAEHLGLLLIISRSWLPRQMEISLIILIRLEWNYVSAQNVSHTLQGVIVEIFVRQRNAGTS